MAEVAEMAKLLPFLPLLPMQKKIDMRNKILKKRVYACVCRFFFVPLQPI